MNNWILRIGRIGVLFQTSTGQSACLFRVDLAIVIATHPDVNLRSWELNDEREQLILGEVVDVEGAHGLPSRRLEEAGVDLGAGAGGGHGGGGLVGGERKIVALGGVDAGRQQLLSQLGAVRHAQRLSGQRHRQDLLVDVVQRRLLADLRHRREPQRLQKGRGGRGGGVLVDLDDGVRKVLELGVAARPDPGGVQQDGVALGAPPDEAAVRGDGEEEDAAAVEGDLDEGGGARGAGEGQVLADDELRGVDGVGLDAVEAREGGLGRGDAAPEVEELDVEVLVGVADVALLLDGEHGGLEGRALGPHEVGDDHGGGARHALLAVDEDLVLGVGGEGVLEPLDDVVQQAGDVLGLAVDEREVLVREAVGKVLQADGAGAVEDVRDAVLLQQRLVLGHRLAAQEQSLGHLVALRVEARQPLLHRHAAGLADQLRRGGMRRGLRAEGAEQLRQQGWVDGGRFWGAGQGQQQRVVLDEVQRGLGARRQRRQVQRRAQREASAAQGVQQKVAAGEGEGGAEGEGGFSGPDEDVGGEWGRRRGCGAEEWVGESARGDGEGN